MKTILPFLLFVFSVSCLRAQVVALPHHIDFETYNFSPHSDLVNAKTTACGLDTVLYPTAKATAYSALNINNVTSATAGSQYFDAPQAITISGAEFFAYAISQPSINVLVQIYAAGLDSLPSGGPIASVTVAVDSSFGGGSLSVLRKVGVFPTPVTLIGAYVVVISNNSADELGLVANSYTAGDGALENLSGLQISGTWFNGANVTVGADAFNADWIFHPLVTYDLTANFVQSFTCLENPSTSVAFVNQSSNIVGNRMYNQAAYLDVEDLSYTWDFDNGSAPVNTFDSIVDFIGTGPFNVSLIDTVFGWTSTCTDVKEVLLYGAPDPDFSSDNIVLQVAFYDSTYSGDNNLSYLWDFGDGNTSTMQNPTHDYAVGGVYTVCLYATNSCGLDTICKSVAVNCPLPLVDFTSNFTDIYEVEFTDVSTNLAASTTWTWNFGDGAIDTMQNPSHTFDTTGIFNVCLIVTNDCGLDSICTPLEVTCNLPVASFTFANTNSSLDYEFTNTSSYEDDSIGVEWYFEDGGSSTQDSPTHTFQTAGSYQVCLIVTSICGLDTVCSTIDAVAGIKDFSDFGASLTPNPTKGQFSLILNELLKDYTLNIYSSIGKLVYTQAIDSKELKVNVEHLNKGLYFIELSNTEKQYVQKLMLE